jgi:hypothetical protein
VELTPALILGMWIGGMAIGGTLVALWRVVGPGYLWLTGGVVTLFGLGAIVADGGPPAIAGTAVAAFAALLARRPKWAAAAFAVSAVLFFAVALGDSPWFPALAGLLFLGGVTSEMTLGHWYLVDPRLPRWALQRLDVIGAVGLAAEIGYVLWKVGAPWTADDSFMGWAFVALAVMTALLVAGVWFSLKEPSYTGVMAATGLSYLAVLTAFGVAMVSRQLTFV